MPKIYLYGIGKIMPRNTEAQDTIKTIDVSSTMGIHNYISAHNQHAAHTTYSESRDAPRHVICSKVGGFR